MFDKWMRFFIAWLGLVGMLCSVSAVRADTTPALFSSFAGNINFTGIAQSLRTSDTSTCNVNTGTTTATLSGIPSGSTISAAYLYWAGSSSDITTTPDYTITFEGSSLSAAANRRYTSTYNYNGSDLYFFSGVADVTSVVNAKGNGTYSFAGLTVFTGDPHCNVSSVMGGWSLIVVYAHASEDLRVINVFEGFQAYRGTSITLTPNNFKIPASPINGKHLYVTWEGDVGNSDPLNGFAEGVTFNGSVLTDANNPANNQFNSISNITGAAATTFGVDADVFNVSAYMTAGATSATSVYSSGGDLVLLSAEVISVTNTPVADLDLTMTRNTALSPGQNATYTLTATNLGPNAETGTITIVDTLPSGLTYSSFSGSGWSCSAVGQTVTCTRAGGLASNASSSVTLTVAVASNATGSKTNSATISGTAFDNISSNNTASDTFSIAADLSISLSRSAALTPGTNGSYLIVVTNNGPSGDPGTIRVTDTLPTGLTYVSGTGTNWSCSAAGQVVTCTLSGSLAPSASAGTLTLTVAVAAGVSGAIINSATVSSTSNLDGSSANNTATDTYTFSAMAYYKMDETSWGTVLDSAGNATVYNGSALGSAVPTGYPPSSPPGSAIAGTPGTCGVGSIPASTSTQGVNTGIDINGNVSNTGTIAFWYNSNAAWNDGNDRMLFDSSNELGNGNADKHFYLVKEGNGRLNFSFENSSDTDYEARTAVNTFAANTWVHIAVTWSMGSTAAVFINGVSAATDTTSGTLGDTNTLYLGTRRFSTVQGAGGIYTANSANGYIDEVYVFNTALNAAGVTSIKNLTHACTSSLNHYELSLPQTSINCMPTTVTVTACADTSNPCTNKATSLNGQTASLSVTGGGTLAASSVTFNAAGDATTTLTYPTASDGTPVSVSLFGESITATAPRKCCVDGTSCSNANSCSTTFNTAGFIFSTSATGSVATIPKQIAGTSSSTYYLRAIQSNTSGSGTPTSACQAALTGVQTVNFAYECTNPTTCYSGNNQLMSINGGASTAIKGNSNGSVVNYQGVNMTFNANGSAPFTFNYSDVGQVRIWANKTIDVTPTTQATLSGSTNAFVVKPAGFTLTNIKVGTVDNPAAADANGAKFAKAGENFSVTATALTSTGSTAYNFGRETTPEGVKLTSALVGGLGLTNAGTLTGSFNGSGVFTNGVATSSFSWNEVGIITLTPSIFDGNYLATGDDVTGTTTGNVGRFYPNHFVLTGGVVPRSDIPRTTGTIALSSTSLTVASGTGILPGYTLLIAGAGPGGLPLQANVNTVVGNTVTLSAAASTAASNKNVYIYNTDAHTTHDGFTYMGEPMLLQLRVDAYNTSGTVTQNYTGNFAKLSATGLGTGSNWFNASCTGTTQCFGIGAVNSTTPLTSRLAIDTSIASPLSSWTAGVGSFSAHMLLSRPVTTTADATWGAYETLNIGGLPRDSDGVTLLGSALDLDADVNSVFERQWLFLTKSRYGRLKIASAYGSELLKLPIEVAVQYWNGSAFVTNVDDNASTFSKNNIVLDNWKNLVTSSNVSITTPSTLTFSAGKSSFTLSAPGRNNTGSVDMSLVTPSYFPTLSKARARFGVYKGSNEIIYIREGY